MGTAGAVASGCTRQAAPDDDMVRRRHIGAHRGMMGVGAAGNPEEAKDSGDAADGMVVVHGDVRSSMSWSGAASHGE